MLNSKPIIHQGLLTSQRTVRVWTYSANLAQLIDEAVAVQRSSVSTLGAPEADVLLERAKHVNARDQDDR